VIGVWWKAATLWSAASLARPIRSGTVKRKAWPRRRHCAVATRCGSSGLKRLEGAALQDGSFMSCSQAAPGNVSRCGSSTGRCICRTEQTRWAKRCAGSFPGAACYQPIELPCFKAAPLQAFGAAQPAACLGPFCVPSSSGTTADRSGQVSLFCVLCVFSRLFLVLLCSLFDELD
jgi:hypothetical protein